MDRVSGKARRARSRKLGKIDRRARQVERDGRESERDELRGGAYPEGWLAKNDGK